MLGRKKRLQKMDAELDITSFMNLMIVLVPVLLMMMVFSRITVLELSLPELGELTEQNELDEEHNQLEILVRQNGIEVFFPQGYLVKELPNIEDDTGDLTYDYDGLKELLKQLKQTLENKGLEKNQATLLLEDEIPYQVIVALMDTTRSYDAVVVASVVQAELFPQISLGDAPLLEPESETDTEYEREAEQ